MNETRTLVKTNTTPVRIVLILTIVAAVMFAWFAIRWQLGNMLAELTPVTQADAKEIGEAASMLAPRDPLAKWLVASTEKEQFAAENLERSVELFEEAVRLSPNDYRWWIEFGRALEQSEKPEKAELAFRQAIVVAPAYSFPQWQIGNFYLRQNRAEEAFAELRKVTEKNSAYREQVFALAWDYFDNDPATVERLSADAPDVRASLALFYTVKNKPRDALRIWNTLSPDEKKAHSEIAAAIAQRLFDSRSHREGLVFARETGVDADAAPETITNAGFEKFIGEYGDTYFGWRVFRNDPKLDIMPDSSVKAEGTRSLKLTFRNYAKPQLYNIAQIVTVEPLAAYRLTFKVRTENLRSGGTPVLEVVNARDSSLLGASAPFAAGSSDWQEIAFDFTVPGDAESIEIRTTRQYCGDECPIAGIVWYDDFMVTRL